MKEEAEIRKPKCLFRRDWKHGAESEAFVSRVKAVDAAARELMQSYDLPTASASTILLRVFASAVSNKCWVYNVHQTGREALDFKSCILRCLINGFGNPAQEKEALEEANASGATLKIIDIFISRNSDAIHEEREETPEDRQSLETLQSFMERARVKFLEEESQEDHQRLTHKKIEHAEEKLASQVLPSRAIHVLLWPICRCCASWGMFKCNVWISVLFYYVSRYTTWRTSWNVKVIG